MAISKIKNIIEEMRAAANDNGLDASALREKTNEQASELEAILKNEKANDRYYTIIAILALMFVAAFAFITDSYNDDLREDVTQKKEIITKFENAVRHDTISMYYDQDGKELTVRNLLDDNLKLMNKISHLEYKNELYEIHLQYIDSRYGIKIIHDKDKSYVEGKKVDSALLLLPVYRDRLSYDSIKKQWTVKRTIVKVGDKSYTE